MKKILVVDDEKEIRQLLNEKLEKSYYLVITAESGERAVEVCKQTVPDLILLDIAMPKMDGYETCEKLREIENIKDVPVLFLTGKDLDPDSILERAEQLCACGHVSKFSSLKDLLIKVKEVIG